MYKPPQLLLHILLFLTTHTDYIADEGVDHGGGHAAGVAEVGDSL